MRSCDFRVIFFKIRINLLRASLFNRCFECNTFIIKVLMLKFTFLQTKSKTMRTVASAGSNQPHAAASSIALPGESLETSNMQKLIGKDDMENILLSRLPSHPKIHRGQLKNGLRFVVLPNKVPLNRFVGATLLINKELQIISF